MHIVYQFILVKIVAFSRILSRGSYFDCDQIGRGLLWLAKLWDGLQDYLHSWEIRNKRIWTIWYGEFWVPTLNIQTKKVDLRLTASVLHIFIFWLEKNALEVQHPVWWVQVADLSCEMLNSVAKNHVEVCLVTWTGNCMKGICHMVPYLQLSVWLLRGTLAVPT
jgi:hypothetical protein